MEGGIKSGRMQNLEYDHAKVEKSVWNKNYSPTGNWTRAFRVRAEYPSQLDHRGAHTTLSLYDYLYSYYTLISANINLIVRYNTYLEPPTVEYTGLMLDLRPYRPRVLVL